jgi:hypothetical protein
MNGDKVRRHEEKRRILVLSLAVAAWLGSFGMAIWGALEFDPSAGHFAPQWYTAVVIILIGMAVATGAALGRIRSVDTLTRIFEAGIMAAQNEKESTDDTDNPED